IKHKFIFGICHSITHISFGHTISKSLIFLGWMSLSFCVVESKPNILSMRCPNNKQSYPWKMRAIMYKKTNKWTITKWSGRHTCMNVMISQDHNKLDFKLIYFCILVSYRKSWKAKQNAIAQAFSD
ncbi:hypothetical protein CR513_32009, partial [Mucuna pruriens]